MAYRSLPIHGSWLTLNISAYILYQQMKGIATFFVKRLFFWIMSCFLFGQRGIFSCIQPNNIHFLYCTGFFQLVQYVSYTNELHCWSNKRKKKKKRNVPSLHHMASNGQRTRFSCQIHKSICAWAPGDGALAQGLSNTFHDEEPRSKIK